MTRRPADEARRALRAAREQAAREETTPPDARPLPGPAEPTPAPDLTPPEPPAADAPRPGDVAREALRRAVAARHARQAADPEPDAPAAAYQAPAEAPGVTSGERGFTSVVDAVPDARAEAARGGSADAVRSARADAMRGGSAAVARSSGDVVPDARAEAARGGSADAVRSARADAARGSVAGVARDGLADAARDESADAAPGGRSDQSRSRHPVPPPDPAPETARHDGAARPSAPLAAPRSRPGPQDRPARPARAARPTGSRARDLRQLLAGAFRMPAEAEEPDRDEAAGQQGPASPGTEAPEPADAPDTAPHAHGRTPGPTPLPAATPSPGTAHTPAPAPATPRVPRTMAAPDRDNDLRRTFPAFPPRSSGDAGFAETWWGNAWVTALEEGALDAKRLARGRGYAEQGHVDAITVTPGLVLAYVRGSRPRPYRVQVRLRTLDDAEWERFLDAAADRPGHIAALLDKEMPHSLADCGVPLLPGPGDLAPRCSCPDTGHPCKHAAALCYQTARLLDADPFVLLLLRGRGERDLLDALSRRSATRAARAAQDKEPAPLPGIRATDALAPRTLPPLPAPLPAPPHPEQPPAYPAAPGGPDPFALDQLATDAAARAHALLTTGRDPVGRLTLWQDAVRLAAARPGSGLTAGTRALYAALASAADRTPAELARAVAAWRQGGLEGLTVLEEPWDPPAGRFDRARPLLLAADLPAFRPWRNRLTHPRGHLQLRLGRDGLWYAYESEPGHDDWWPRGTPDLDPVGALTGLGIPGDL
ncbi:SWIM zinc finger family protein [Streptomyces bullii]|uniref:SWIM zinc finger family protein n=1 Tax=Streptomyces bullii TaxID=349910 RepID=A0ABW0UVR2_9ACTN